MTSLDSDRDTSRPAPSRHGPIAQLLIAWSPLSGILIAYAVAQWINAPLAEQAVEGDRNRLGFSLHVAGPPRADEAVFGAVPTVHLQQWLVDGAAHWYDSLAALIYVTHFVVIPVVTGLVWFRMRDRFTAWLTAVVTFTVVGVTGYVVYPAAPPWWASEQDRIGAVDRISGLGWHYLHLEPIARLTELGQGQSNPVAAMPSLHAGAALLVALFLWPSVRSWVRGALLLYAGSMAWVLVYTGEHYVVDVVAGWLTAGVAVVVGLVGLVGLVGRVSASDGGS
ncbi:phosphatase PAP2 family protein [Nocardioides lijunqiniae]|uniref:phosphatase PAP2 family protein n=1 Tax=Nocardioides lijunqiniae TaxID=2760832 RepID=UPI0018788A2E|nr:phosphatase PAP2 family protein [Nocardioides lijunqiniae]